MSKREKMHSHAPLIGDEMDASTPNSGDGIARRASSKSPGDAQRSIHGIGEVARDENWRLVGEDLSSVARDRDYLRSRLLIEERRRIAAEAKAHALEASLSWRLTAPIRFVSGHAPGMARAFRAVGRKTRAAFRNLSGTDPQSSEPEPGSDAALLLASPLFDEKWYRLHCSSAGPTRASAIAHFLAFGSRLGMDPHPLFLCGWYLSENPDVLLSGQNPLVHYLRTGDLETRNPHPLFDVAWYTATYKAALSSFKGTCLEHFLANANEKRCDPHILFACDWYLRMYPDLARSRVNPLVDYLTEGFRSGRNPHPLFDGEWYRQQAGNSLAPDVPPLLHYVLSGAKAGISPLEDFNAEFVKKSTSGMDVTAETPLATFIRMRSCFRARQASGREDMPSAILKSDLRKPRLFVGVVAYDASREDLERFSRSVRASAQANERLFVEIGLISNGPRDVTADALELGFAYALHVDNRGFGQAQNLLMKRAFAGGADLYVGANPDGFFHRMCLSYLASASDYFAGSCLVEAREFPGEHPKIFDPLSLDTPWACGACLGIPRRIWEDIGGFDEKIFMYCEDVDLSWRARQAGWGVKHVPFALFYHDTRDRSASSWRQKQSLTSAHYLAHKWNARQLETAVVAEMRRLEIPVIPHDSVDDGVASTSENACPNIVSVVDEDHGLSFAPVRWS
jgi:GT2 family glycosyltransferase